MRSRIALFVVVASRAVSAQEVPAVQAYGTAVLTAAFAAAQPSPEEARWTLVPWRHSLTDALAEAKATGEPIYLFVNDGDVESGRC